MSCYLRHLKGILAEAGIEVTATNKSEADRALHQIAGVQYKDCPGAWRALKQQMATEAGRADIAQKLRQAMAK